MPQDDQPDWAPDFAQRSPLFEPLRALWMSIGAPAFARLTRGWPDLDAYQQVLDARLATVFACGGRYTQPHDLQPFPILGMPGWDPANADAAYYNNTRYFRPGRRTD